jgi:hypothetical protein
MQKSGICLFFGGLVLIVVLGLFILSFAFVPEGFTFEERVLIILALLGVITGITLPGMLLGFVFLWMAEMDEIKRALKL